MDVLLEHRRRVAALQRPNAWPHPVAAIEVIETHISTVLLGGDYAYKLKKPLDLGFLDFTSLERRHHFCCEEVRLNRRLAPGLYLDVVPVTEDAEGLRIDGSAHVVDWAVKMRRFPQSALLGNRLGQGAPELGLIERLGGLLARFHADAAVCADADYATPERIARRALENFDVLTGSAMMQEQDVRLEHLHRWTLESVQRLTPVFERRRSQGHVRECHGDLHLDNIILWDGELAAFDCIEFDPDLRWIDTANDLAFTIMDLHFRAQPVAAHHLLNAYLEDSGDYEALAVIPFYGVYRALVRAMVDTLLAEENPATAVEQAARARVARYLGLAEQLMRSAPRQLLITFGAAGSGKSTAAQALVERFGCIRLRSDVERKRLLGLGKLERTGSAPGAGAYTSEMSRRTYTRLRGLAESVLEAGFVPVVDATFLDRVQRRRFAELAQQCNAGFAILAMDTTPAQLRARLVRRQESARHEASEADLAVLERQLQQCEPLDAHERKQAISVAPLEAGAAN